MAWRCMDRQALALRASAFWEAIEMTSLQHTRSDLVCEVYANVVIEFLASLLPFQV
jgi:hypothetical protein